jgi:hypothetical protein
MIVASESAEGVEVGGRDGEDCSAPGCGDGSSEGDIKEQQMGERGKFVSTVPSRSSSNSQRRFPIRLTRGESYGNGTVSVGIRG